MTLELSLHPRGMMPTAGCRRPSRIPGGVAVLVFAGASLSIRGRAADQLQAQKAKMGRCTSCEVAWWWPGRPLVRDARCPGCDGRLHATNWMFTGPWLDGSDGLVSAK